MADLPTDSSSMPMFASAAVSSAQDGFRADRALAALDARLGRREAKQLFRSGAVRLNGKPARGHERVEPGDRFEYPHPGAGFSRGVPQGKPAPRLTTRHGRQVLRLYEDDALMVLNKPPEIPIHHGPEGPTRRETLEDVLARAYPGCGMRSMEGGGEDRSKKPRGRGRDHSGSREEDEDEAPIAGSDEHGESFIIRRKKSTGGEAAGVRGREKDPSGIRIPKSEIPNRLYFVHRLDMETTGCLVVAKNEAARDALIRAFSQHQVDKTYWAVVVGEVPWDHKTVPRPITYVRTRLEAYQKKKPKGRAPEWAKRKRIGKPLRAVKMGVALSEGDPKGKACRSDFFVEARFQGYTLLRCEPKTGRMHQLRVHLAAEGFPLAYDQLYGRRSPLRRREFDLPNAETEQGETVVLNRLPLHASKISFQHPVGGGRLTVEAPLPRDLKTFLRLLKKFRAR